MLTVITKGYVGAVKTLLREEGLLDNFDMVIGFIGGFYGESEYDNFVKDAAFSFPSESLLSFLVPSECGTRKCKMCDPALAITHWWLSEVWQEMKQLL